MGLVVNKVEVPYEVETAGPQAVETFLKDPEAWHKKRESERTAQRKTDMETALESASDGEVMAMAGQLGIALTKGTGQDGQAGKGDYTAAILKHEFGKEK